LKLKDLKLIFDEHDIILLTETWTDNYSDLDVNGYEYFVLNRTAVKKACKRNSGGMIIYIKSHLVGTDTLFFKRKDDILWVKLSSEVLNISKDIYVGLCYILLDDSSRQSLVEDNVFDRLLDSCINVENHCNGNAHFILCGDYNARTSILKDFASDDDISHLEMLPDDYFCDTDLPRRSKDQGHVNNNGLHLIDFCKQTGYED
jgi:hypothetical protein